MTRNRWIIVGVVAVVIIGFIGFNLLNANNAQQELIDSLQTVELEKGELTATIGATGTVRSYQNAMLTWETSGTVEQVLAGLGDEVDADQILAILAKDSLPQNVIQAEADLIQAQRDLEDIQTSSLTRAQALTSMENAQDALDDVLNPALQQAEKLIALDAAEDELENLLNSDVLTAQLLEAVVLAEQAVEDAQQEVFRLNSTAAQFYIDDAKAQVVLTEDRLKKAEDRYEPWANKAETNLTRANLLSMLSAAQADYDAAVRNLNALMSTADDVDAAVGDANLAKAVAELEDAQREYERAKDGPSAAEIALAEAKLVIAQDDYNAIKNGSSDGDIALAQAQLEEAQEEWERLKDGPDPDDITVAEVRVISAQAALDMQYVMAPFAGTITDVMPIPGDQVSMGVQAFRLDNLNTLLMDVEVSEVDINQVKVGQKVTVSFDAIIANVYEGVVVEVDPVGTVVGGVVNFNVTVELLETDEEVRPGMTAGVNIVVSEKTDVLIVPNRAVRVLDGDRVVYILENGAVTPVVVVLGSSSDLYSEIIEGDLTVGDVIILNPSSDIFSSMGPGSGMGMGGGF